jgi:hypothetical protein
VKRLRDRSEKLVALLAVLAVTGCAAVPAGTPPIAHPFADAASPRWLAHRPTDEITIDTRAISAAMQTERPAASLNKKGKPRTALWVGVAIAGAIHIHNVYELTHDLVDCMFGLNCDDD